MAQRTNGRGDEKTRTMKSICRNSHFAFTLTEMLVVIAIVGILAAITLGIYGSAKRKGVESRLKAELSAIELALENYKAKNSQYPYSEPWGYEYPPKGWSSGSPAPLGNQLYRDLVTRPMAAGKKPHLPDVREGQYESESLLAPVPDLRGGAPFVKWYYNSNNPRYNKNTYDLWVEYGDLGKDKDDPLDDTVKIISNWNN